MVTRFARHQTFQPRYGWLPRGYRMVKEEPGFFLDKNAHFRLGVGKNMAPAIRYWLEAFGLIGHEDTLFDDPVMRHNVAQKGEFPTAFGRALLDPDGGYDPYLEQTASLWLLHWQLSRNLRLASAWYYLFHKHDSISWNPETMALEIREWAKQSSGREVALSSIKKDLQIIHRMYTLPDTRLLKKNKGYEELIDSVFSSLDLLRKGPSGEVIFNTANEGKIPKGVILYACVDVLSQSSAKTVTLSSLLMAEGSPGRAFRLTENALISALESPMARKVNLAFGDTAGARILSLVKGSAEATREKVLKQLYGGRS